MPKEKGRANKIIETKDDNFTYSSDKEKEEQEKREKLAHQEKKAKLIKRLEALIEQIERRRNEKSLRDKKK